jgi:hypothetical protein
MKKLKQIEFNEELIGKEGIVVCLGDSKVPLEVFVSKTRKNNPIIIVLEDGNVCTLAERFSYNNLAMYQEVESRVFYINEYQEGLGLICHKEEDALAARQFNPNGYIRTIKLVEEIE